VEVAEGKPAVDNQVTEGVRLSTAAEGPSQDGSGKASTGPEDPVPYLCDAEAQPKPQEREIGGSEVGDTAKSDSQMLERGKERGLSAATDHCETLSPVLQTGSRAEEEEGVQKEKITQSPVSLESPQVHDTELRPRECSQKIVKRTEGAFCVSSPSRTDRLKILTTVGDTGSDSQTDSLSSSSSKESIDGAVADSFSQGSRNESRLARKRAKAHEGLQSVLKDRSPSRLSTSKKCLKTFGRKTAWKALPKKLQNRLLQKMQCIDAPRWSALIRRLKTHATWKRGLAASLSLSVPMSVCLRAFLRKNCK